MPFTLDDTPSSNGADLNVIGDTLTQEIPEPQQHAIDEATAKGVEETGAAQIALDALGIPWNPSEHATGIDGKGVKTSTGKWRKKRGVKGSESFLNTDAAQARESVEEKEAGEKRTLEHQNRMAGAMAGTMLVRISAAVGGPEFLPRTITVPGGLTYNEEQFLQTAFGDYFVAKGITDIPPGLVLVSALSMYYLPRFQQPTVREKGGKFVKWCKRKIEWVYVTVKYRGKKKPDRENEDIKKDGVFDNVSGIQTPPI